MMVEVVHFKDITKNLKNLKRLWRTPIAIEIIS